MSRFHNYSFGNVLEIARQMPTATRVAGFWTWKNLGRSVNSGAKGIRILTPIVGVRRKKDSEAEKDITTQNTRALLGFRNAYVFDISQTSGVDLPTIERTSGDPGEGIERLAAFLKSQGIQLVYNPKIAPALGMSYGGGIAILPGQSKAEEFSTLVHETAHEMLHKAERRTATPRPCARPRQRLWPSLSVRRLALSRATHPPTTSSCTTAMLPCWPRAWRSFALAACP